MRKINNKAGKSVCGGGGGGVTQRFTAIVAIPQRLKGRRRRNNWSWRRQETAEERGVSKTRWGAECTWKGGGGGLIA